MFFLEMANQFIFTNNHSITGAATTFSYVLTHCWDKETEKTHPTLQEFHPVTAFTPIKPWT